MSTTLQSIQTQNCQVSNNDISTTTNTTSDSCILCTISGTDIQDNNNNTNNDIIRN